MKEKSNHIFSLKDGTLYPILYRLEDEHYVVSKWEEGEGKKVPRKYYEITPEGRKALPPQAHRIHPGTRLLQP